MPICWKEVRTMTKEAFVENIIADLKEQLDPSLKIISREVEKFNGVKKNAINIIEEGNPLSPTIYIDVFYEQYKTMKMSLNEVVNEIKDIYTRGCDERENYILQAKKVSSFEAIKDEIKVKIATEEMNQSESETYPYAKKGDFKILPYIEFKCDEKAIGSARINENMLKKWGKSIDEVCDVAMSNYSTSDYVLFDINAIIHEMMFEAMLDELNLNETELEQYKTMAPKPENLLETSDSLEGFDMCVLTNDARFNGANAILNENLLEKLFEKTGSDFVIVPSSIHEVIIIPNLDNVPIGLEELPGIIAEINGNEVSPEERLSNKVYRYDSQRKEVVDNFTYEQRKVLESIDANTNNEITSFVEKLDNFLYDYDVYEYNDTVGSDIEDRELFKQTNCSAIKLGETEHIEGYLGDIIEETELDSVKNDAKKLLDDMDKIQNQIHNTKDSSLEVSKRKSL